MRERKVTDRQRELRLSAAFAKLAHMITGDHDMVDLLHTLVEESSRLSGAQAGAALLADTSGELRLVASTSEKADLVEVNQLVAGAGPCLECYAMGVEVSVEDADVVGAKWPEFRDAMKKQGFRSLHSTPIRVRGQVVGAMALLGASAGALHESDVAVVRALADVAAVGIVQERSPRELQAVATRLQHALNDRIVIEQAMGMLSQLHSITIEQAFRALRAYARDNNSTIRASAERVTNRSIDLAGYEKPAPRVPRKKE